MHPVVLLESAPRPSSGLSLMSPVLDFAPAVAGTALYAAFATALLAAASRWVRPIRPWTALVLALLPLVFTGSALLTGRVRAPLDLQYDHPPLRGIAAELGMDEAHSHLRYDVAHQMIPWRKAVRYAIKHGEWPLLNPFILSGDVLAAAAQPAAYHPIHVASYLLPMGPAFSFTATAAFLWAILAGFLFAREIGCREAAATVAAAAWGFCNFHVVWSGWPIVLAPALLPFVLLATRRAVRRPGVGTAALLALGLCLLLLSGHPESTLHVVAVAIPWGILELALAFHRHRDEPGRWRRVLRPLPWVLAAGVVALSLAAIDLLPFLDALGQTREAQARVTGGHGTDPAVPWPEAISRLRTVIVPYTYGLPWRESQHGRVFGGAHWTGYAGSAIWGAFVLGLWRGRWRGRWALLVLALVGWSLHVAAPGLSDLLARLPLFELAINRRTVFVAGFATAMLVGLGVEAALAEPGGRRRLAWTTLGAGATIALALFLLEPGLRAEGRSPELLVDGRLRELVPPFVLGLVLLAVPYRRFLAPAVLVLLLAQRLWQYERLDRAWPDAAVAPAVPQLVALAAKEEPGRVVGVYRALPPNMAALWELEDVRGYQAMRNARLARTYPLWVDFRHRGLHNARVTDLSSPFLDLMNVRHAIVAGRPRRGALPAGWKLAARGRGFTVLENRHALPRAFVPRRLRFTEDHSRTLLQMRRQDDFGSLAWIELPPPGGGSPQQTNGRGEVVTRRQPQGLDLVATMESPAWVVISQTAWNGWRAFRGDEELPLAVADHAFLALHLEAGEHRVALRFRPRSFEIGRALSATTLALLLALWAARSARSRRSRRRLGDAPPSG